MAASSSSAAATAPVQHNQAGSKFGSAIGSIQIGNIFVGNGDVHVGSNNERSNILAWLSNISVSASHDNFRRKLGDKFFNSGQWLLLSSDFETWNRSKSGALSLQGTTGTGKSCLASIVIEHCNETQKTAALAYFYCIDKSDSNEILRSLVAQLCAASVDIPQAVVECYKANQRLSGSKMSATLCEKFLIQLINASEQTIIAIDALDECDNAPQLLATLQRVVTSTGKARLFLTSQPTDMSTLSNHRPVKLTPKRTAIDVHNFITSEVFDEQRKYNSGISSEQCEKLSRLLNSSAEGMFKWVELQLEIFLSPRTPLIDSRDIEEKLSALEKGSSRDFFQLYDQLYERNIFKQPHLASLLQRTLRWMLGACTPMSCSHIVEWVAMEEDGDVDLWKTEELILKAGKNFILKSRSSELQFVHSSVRSYLQQKRSADGAIELYSPQPVNANLAVSCLRLLFKTVGNSTNAKDHFRLNEEYSAAYWPRHTQLAGRLRREGLLQKQLFDLLLSNQSESLLSSWFKALDSHEAQEDTWADIEGFPDQYVRITKLKARDVITYPPDPLFTCAVWGFEEIVEKLLKRAQIPEKKRWRMSKAKKVYDLRLLRNGNLGKPVLCLAVNYEHLPVIRLLMDEGASRRFVDDHGRNVYHFAAKSGNLKVLKTLMQKPYFSRHAKYIDATDSHGRSPLSLAAGRGHLSIVKLLAEQKTVKANKKDGIGCTPLLHAARWRQVEVVQYLMSRSDVNCSFLDYCQFFQPRSSYDVSFALPSPDRSETKILTLIMDSDPVVMEKLGRVRYDETALKFWGETKLVPLQLAVSNQISSIVMAVSSRLGPRNCSAADLQSIPVIKQALFQVAGYLDDEVVSHMHWSIRSKFGNESTTEMSILFFYISGMYQLTFTDRNSFCLRKYRKGPYIHFSVWDNGKVQYNGEGDVFGI